MEIDTDINALLYGGSRLGGEGLARSPSRADDRGAQPTALDLPGLAFHGRSERCAVVLRQGQKSKQYMRTWRDEIVYAAHSLAHRIIRYSDEEAEL